LREFGFVPRFAVFIVVLGLLVGRDAFASEPMEVVARLCSAECGGRLAGTDGERRAAVIVAGELSAIGAQPLPGQTAFEMPFALGEPLAGQGRNVVGWLPPRDPAAGAVLLCAHYDHLGDGRVVRGESLPGEVGRMHPGADDNASGVAAVLRAAALLANDPRRRSGVIVAFVSAEEAGCQGSKALVEGLRGAGFGVRGSGGGVGERGIGARDSGFGGGADSREADARAAAEESSGSVPKLL